MLDKGCTPILPISKSVGGTRSRCISWVLCHGLRNAIQRATTLRGRSTWVKTGTTAIRARVEEKRTKKSKTSLPNVRSETKKNRHHRVNYKRSTDYRVQNTRKWDTLFRTCSAFIVGSDIGRALRCKSVHNSDVQLPSARRASTAFEGG